MSGEPFLSRLRRAIRRRLPDRYRFVPGLGWAAVEDRCTRERVYYTQAPYHRATSDECLAAAERAKQKTVELNAEWRKSGER